MVVVVRDVGRGAAGGAVPADDEAVLVVGEVLERGLARGPGVAPLLAVGGVREVAHAAAGAADAAVEAFVGPAVAVEPLHDGGWCSYQLSLGIWQRRDGGGGGGGTWKSEMWMGRRTWHLRSGLNGLRPGTLSRGDIDWYSQRLSYRSPNFSLGVSMILVVKSGV